MSRIGKHTARNKTRPAPPCIPITDYIAKLEKGGEYRPSRRALAMMAAGDTAGALMQSEIEATRGAVAARRRAKYLKRKREGNNKYYPNGGLR